MYRLISVLLYGFGYDDLGVTCFYFEIMIEIPFQREKKKLYIYRFRITKKKKKKVWVMCKYFIKLQEILGVQLSVYFRSESCLHFI